MLSREQRLHAAMPLSPPACSYFRNSPSRNSHFGILEYIQHRCSGAEDRARHWARSGPAGRLCSWHTACITAPAVIGSFHKQICSAVCCGKEPPAHTHVPIRLLSPTSAEWAARSHSMAPTSSCPYRSVSRKSRPAEQWGQACHQFPAASTPPHETPCQCPMSTTTRARLDAPGV